MSTEKLSSVSTNVPVGTILPCLLTQNNIPEGWYLCNGQIVSNTLPIAKIINPVNGNVTLPNLGGLTLIGAGVSQISGKSYQLSQIGGEEQHQLTIAEMPSHSHIYGGCQQTPNACTEEGGGRFDCYPQTVPDTPVGGDLPHNNMQPYYVVEYMIYCGVA